MRFYSLSALAFPLALANQAPEIRTGHLDQTAQDEPPRGRSIAGIPAGTLNHVVPMTDELRKLWVDKHNEWRNQAAGGELADRDGITVEAKYLPKLTYDMDLERNSEEYGKLCNWDHSKPAGFNTLPYSIGENLYVTSFHTSNSQHVEALHGWSIEHLDYDYTDDGCNPGTMCGHFTQVVDKRSTRVGCAMVDCASMVNIGSVFATNGGTYAICQYYGPGNYWGTTSFDYGTVGSECPNGMDADYPNLCATVGEDPCNLPETGSDRCAPGGTCSAAGPLINGLSSDFTCSCDGNFQGRWCEGSTCTDQQYHIGKKLTGYNGIYFLNGNNQPEVGLNGGGIFIFQGHEKDAANNWCSSNSDNGFACKSIVKTDFGQGYYFWVPNKLEPATMPVEDDPSGQGEVWARDCSAAETTQAATTEAPTTNAPTTQAPTTNASTTQAPATSPTDTTQADQADESNLPNYERSPKQPKMKLIQNDGTIRLLNNPKFCLQADELFIKNSRHVIFADCQYDQNGDLSDTQKFEYNQSTGQIIWSYSKNFIGKRGVAHPERCLASVGKYVRLEACDDSQVHQSWWYDGGYVRQRREAGSEKFNHCLVVSPYSTSLDDSMPRSGYGKNKGNKKQYWIEFKKCAMESFGHIDL